MRALGALLLIGATATCAQIIGVNGVTIGPPGAGGQNGQGGAASGGAGGAASGGAGGGPAKDCSNDPADYQCVPAAPAMPGPAWLGPVAVNLMAPMAGACPLLAPNHDASGGWGALTAPAPSCGACSCGPIMGVMCQPPLVRGFFGQGCLNQSGSLNLQMAGDCEPILNGKNGFGSVRSDSAFPNGQPSCQATSNAKLSPATFADQALVCEAPSLGGCGQGAACAPRPAALGSNGGWQICIASPGNVPCPAGSTYSTQQVIYLSVSDGRGCSCKCDIPEPPQCGGKVLLYSDSNCQQAAGSVEVPLEGQMSVCSNANPPFQSKKYEPVIVGSCQPVGAPQPMGMATPTEPLTLCCLSGG